jgi:drug/metabolite transporter (DMT)-like permease
VIYGLGAALGWGLADLGAAVSGRRIGSVAATVLAQVTSLLAVGILVVALRPEWTGDGGNVLVLGVNGAIVGLAYLAHYRALELGPVAIVSPIVAAYAVPPVVLAVVLLDETLAGWVLAGAIVTLLGVVVASADLRAASGERFSGPGIPVGIASMLLFGLATFTLGRQAQEVGWLPAMALGRLFSVCTLLVVSVILRPRFREAATAGLAVAAVAGLADILGVAMYSFGAEVGLISVVTAASATFVLFPIVGGVALFGERPGLTQYVGIAMVVGGLLLLGLG